MKLSNKIKPLMISLVLAATLFLIFSDTESLTAAPQDINKITINPYVVETGSSEDLQNMTAYRFQSDGETLVPVTISQNASFVMEMYVKDSGYIALELYKSNTADELPVYLPCQCSSNYGTVHIFLKKGTYYLRFPENNYEIRAALYPNDGKKLNHNDIVAGYCDYLNCSTFTYTATKSGYVTLNYDDLAHTTSSLGMNLCDTKGNEITELHIFNNLTPEKFYFTVKKGKTYKIKLSPIDGNGINFYQLSLKFAEKSDNGGTSKKKATELEFGSKATGLIYAEDSIKKTKWFKVVIPKKQRVEFDFSSILSSGSFSVEILDSKGKKLAETIIYKNNLEGSFQLLNSDGKTKIPKGTYYLKISKADVKTTGYFSMKLSKH